MDREKMIKPDDLELVEATLRLAEAARDRSGVRRGQLSPPSKGPVIQGQTTKARKPEEASPGISDAGNEIIEVQIRSFSALLRLHQKYLDRWKTIQLALGTLAVLLVAFLIGKLLIGEPQLEDLVAGSGLVFSGGAVTWVQGRIADEKADLKSTNESLTLLRKGLSS